MISFPLCFDERWYLIQVHNDPLSVVLADGSVEDF